MLSRLGYPDAATRRVPYLEILERLEAANQAVGKRAVEPASFVYGYWDGVKDERLRTAKEFRERNGRA